MDALAMTIPDNSFDLVWACESGEHMPDKRKYVEEMVRVLKPGVFHYAHAHTCIRYVHVRMHSHVRTCTNTCICGLCIYVHVPSAHALTHAG